MLRRAFRYGDSREAQIQWDVAGPADWNTGSNWAGGVVPGVGSAGDQASVINGGTADITTPAPDILGFRIGAFAGGDVGTVNMSGAGSLRVTVFSSVGEVVIGTVNTSGNASLQSENDNFSVGAGGGTGLLDMSGDSSFLHTAPGGPFRGLQIGRDLGAGGTMGTVRIRDNASISAPNGILANGGEDAPFDGVGLLQVFGGNVSIDANQYQQSALSTLELNVDGTGISPIVATQVTATTGGGTNPTVALDGTLDVNFSLPPSLGASFTIIDNQFTDAIGGVFATVNPSGLGAGQSLSINYAGGTGNDVVLTVTPEPSTAILIAMGLAISGLRRRTVHWV